MNTTYVLRTNISPYQSPDFILWEKTALEKIPGIKYLEGVSEKTPPNILLTNTHTQLNEFLPKWKDSIKLILHPNSGYDHFIKDIPLCSDIPIVAGNQIRAQAVAEYSLRCLFQGLIPLPDHKSWNKERKWDRPLISETPIWIFGFGHVGKILASTLSSLGANITVIDPYVKDCPYKKLNSWKEGELSQAKVIILAMGLNPTSEKLLDAEFFNHSHKELLLINPARGKLINESALKNFLATHPNSFAFLDTFENEPFGQEWTDSLQVWKTSHIAGVEAHLDQRIINFEEKMIRDWMSLGKDSFLKKHQNEIVQDKYHNGILI